MTLPSIESWLLLIVQIALLVATIFAPRILRLRWIGYFIYTLAATFLWLAYTVLAMLFDGKVGKDIPGAGYLFMGFLGWIVGTILFLTKISRQK